ncbi:zinc ABC transporter substrate-binding protein [Desulfobacula sp.]|uniref:metal ABC transporter solute-binding protein, Zn/Mn family n=1 Tax=Desulfobacula sp. TaxID=2593537 RepID=UPI002613427E|nr:zinc ABC transporter substrate-binding protein [Desulfobacula sp.]
MKFLMTYGVLVTAALIFLLPLNSSAMAPVKVQVSILPQKYFVDRIGRDHVKVDVLVKPGKNPATYAPSPDQIKTLAASDVYFRIGVPFENGMLHKIASIAGITVVDTRKGIVLRTMAPHGHGKEDHGQGTGLHEDRDLMGKDPHIWMNPLMVKQQAHTIFLTLSTLDPDHQDTYQTNYDGFIQDLDTLDSRLKKTLSRLKGKNLFVFHPTFGYFTEAYGLKQVAIETMGKTPKGKTLSNIIKLAKQQNARVIFAQPQFDRNAAQKIASAINGRVVTIDPLAYDYLVNMDKMAQTIIGALKK